MQSISIGNVKIAGQEVIEQSMKVALLGYRLGCEK